MNSNDGAPGQTLVTLDRSDPTGTGSIPDLQFDTVDLTAYSSQLAALSDPFYVSIGNAGSDTNWVYLPLSEYDNTAADTPGWAYLGFGGGSHSWAPFTGIFSTNSDGSRDFFLNDRVPTIRATFVNDTATSDEDDAVVPERVTLESNYPNPFNPSTSIAFALPSAAQARLAVYDLLGREVAVLVDGAMQAGRHEVRFDAGSLASGMYLYSLDAGQERLTRTMLLMK